MAATNYLVNITAITVGAVVITIVITIATYATATSVTATAIDVAVTVCGRESGRNCETILNVDEQYKHANQCNTADVISLM